MCRVPHLVLQPLVENAIRHGIAPRRAPGLISIEGIKIRSLLLRLKTIGLGKQSRSETDNREGPGIG